MKFFLCCCGLLFFCLFAEAEDAFKMQKIEGGYSIRIPSNMRVSVNDSAEDFLIYNISEENKIILRLYIGNHPSEQKYVHPAKKSKTVIAGYKADVIRWVKGIGISDGEVRIRLLRGAGWPIFAQFKYTDLASDQEEVAQEIINSFSK